MLSDYERMAGFMPGMIESRIVSRDGSTVIVDQRADQAVLFFKQRIDVRLRIVETPPRRLSIRAVSGSFSSLDASYELSPVTAFPDAGADGRASREPQTRIEYRARFVPDFDLPRMIGHYVVKRSLERHLAALAGEIDRRVAAPAAPEPEHPQTRKENR